MAGINIIQGRTGQFESIIIFIVVETVAIILNYFKGDNKWFFSSI